MLETRVRSLGQKIPWRRKWQPTPVFLPREFHGQRNLVCYSPWSRQESDTSERLSRHIHQMITSMVNTDWTPIDVSVCNPAMTLVLKWRAQWSCGSAGGFLEFGSSIYPWPGVRQLFLGPFLKDSPDCFTPKMKLFLMMRQVLKKKKTRVWIISLLSSGAGMQSKTASTLEFECFQSMLKD